MVGSPGGVDLLSSYIGIIEPQKKRNQWYKKDLKGQKKSVPVLMLRLLQLFEPEPEPAIVKTLTETLVDEARALVSITVTKLIAHWESKTPTQQKIFTTKIAAVVALLYYVLSPSLTSKPVMFSKRPDKHTTGLINLRNDCFANSSVQAYSSLPGLTEYLNNFHASFAQLSAFLTTHSIDPEDLMKLKISRTKKANVNSKFKRASTRFDIPLHLALASIVQKLQETQLTSRTVSVWTFLHCLESIFNAKISRSQHDAHELTQLINETLEHENLKIRLVHKFLQRHLHELLGSIPRPSDYEALERIHVPEFPFSGLVLSQMRCLACKGVSKPSFTPFLMLTLHTPATASTDLETLLNENESESIEGYQCLKCRIEKIVQNEDLSAPSSEFIPALVKLSTDPNLCINDDLSKELEAFVKSYKFKGLDISTVTSTVCRKTQILKPPKIFGLHLSRSSFVGGNISRNPCRVSFKDNLTLSIGNEYHGELQKFQDTVEEAEADVSGAEFPAVLTTDVNDMEDEEVQREDIDVLGEEDNKTEGEETEGETEEDTEGDTDKTEDDDDDEVNSIQNSVATSNTFKDSKNTDLTSIHTASGTNKNSSPPQETLNNAPITRDQTDDLKEHFKRFKFNENDSYKYRLKAVIRHVGSHSQGHYECYKRKPLFVKDAEGNIFKLSPEIEDIDETEDAEPDSESRVTADEITSEKSPNAESEEPGIGRKFSLSSRKSSISRRNPSAGKDTASIRGVPVSKEEEEDSSSGIRRKLSTIMGRRPSVYQANPSQSDIHEIIHSGIATPAELLVGGLQQQDYFSSQLSNAVFNKPESPKKVKMKKIPSLIKTPFWRISDASVTEVSKDSVLIETTSVYMLYYERVDRKQIKQKR